MTSRLLLKGIELKLGSFHLAINLTIELGCLGIFGPSGSGKTTLLELIAGLRRPRVGQVELGGVVLTDLFRPFSLPIHQRQIGYVPQDLALFSHLSVRENIWYGVSINDGESDVNAHVGVLCDVLELTPFLNRWPDSLSGGEKQRVALARALAARPKLLLLDEPLTGLDSDRKDSALHYLRLLRQQWPVPTIYVSHQAEEIATLCDEVIVLREGSIDTRGRPGDIFEMTKRPFYRLRAELGTAPETGHAAAS